MVGLGDLKGIFQPKRFWLSILGSTVIENNQVIVAFLGYRNLGLSLSCFIFTPKMECTSLTSRVSEQAALSDPHC